MFYTMCDNMTIQCATLHFYCIGHIKLKTLNATAAGIESCISIVRNSCMPNSDAQSSLASEREWAPPGQAPAASRHTRQVSHQLIIGYNIHSCSLGSAFE